MYVLPLVLVAQKWLTLPGMTILEEHGGIETANALKHGRPI